MKLAKNEFLLDADFASCGLRVAGYGLRVTGCGLRVTGYGLRVTGCGFKLSLLNYAQPATLNT